MKRQGFILVMAIWVAFLVLITGLSVVYMAQSNLDIAANLRVGAEVKAMAQAGLDHALLLVRAESENTVYAGPNADTREVSYNEGSYQYTVSIKRIRRPDERRSEYQVRSVATGPRKSSYTAHQVLARMAGPPDQAEGFMAQGAITLDHNLSLVNFVGGNSALHSNTQLSASNASFVDTIAPLLSVSSAATAVGPYSLTSTPPITLRNGLTAEDPKAQIALTMALYTPRNCVRVAASPSLTLYSQTDLDRLWTNQGLSFNTCIDIPAALSIQAAGNLELSGRKLMVMSLTSDANSSLNLNNTTLYASDQLSIKKVIAHDSMLLSRNRLSIDPGCVLSPSCTFTGTNILVSENDTVEFAGAVTPPSPDQVGLYVYAHKRVYVKTEGTLNALIRSGTEGVALDQATDITGGMVTTGGIEVKGDLTLRKPQGFSIPGNPSPPPTLLQGPVEILSRN